MSKLTVFTCAEPKVTFSAVNFLFPFDSKILFQLSSCNCQHFWVWPMLLITVRYPFSLPLLSLLATYVSKFCYYKVLITCNCTLCHCCCWNDCIAIKWNIVFLFLITALQLITLACTFLCSFLMTSTWAALAPFWKLLFNRGSYDDNFWFVFLLNCSL